jgi:L-amino acid N-acyltransferase YncA
MIVQGQEVVDWVVEGTGTLLSARAQGIGLWLDNKLVAGAAYDMFSGQNIFAHQRIEGKTNRAYWIAITDYPFNALGCNRVTVIIDDSNEKSMNIVKHMGFVEEGRLHGAAEKGNDMVFMVLWWQNCKMLNWKAISC